MNNTERSIAIGDIHGCYKTFRALIEEVIIIGKGDTLYLLGDYIDRGPRVKEVIDYILQLKSQGYKIVTLMGNHEELLLKSIESSYYFDSWISLNGGNGTLRSFGVYSAGQLDQKYLDFFNQMISFAKLEKYILVHGGLNFEIENPFYDEPSMLWMRNRYIDMVKTGGRKVIVGHTPVCLDKVRDSLKTNLIMLDGGCVYDKTIQGGGHLCAFDMTNGQLYFKENIENK